MVTSLDMSGDAYVFLSLGSNVGDRATNLDRAIDALPGAGVIVIRSSSIYESEPVDFLAQPWFLNCIVEGKTSLPPGELLRKLQGIELQLGSKKLVKRGPRILDLDIIFHGANVVREDGLEIPHPRMAGRRFVLVPLAEIAPGVRHPVTGLTMSQLLADTQDKSEVRLWKPPAMEIFLTR